MEHLALLIVKFLALVIEHFPGRVAELVLYLVLIVAAISVVLFIRYRLRLMRAKKAAAASPPARKKPRFLVD
jgi:hypothetical protein